MGLAPAPEGVTLRFLNADQTERRPPVTGSQVRFFSTPRSNRLAGLDPSLSGSELGSQDWLTDVIVADTPEKLATMQPLISDSALSSTSSRRVFIQFKVTDPVTGAPDEDTEVEAVTVAPPENITPAGGGHLLTTEIHVFPAGTRFGIEHENNAPLVGATKP